MAYQQQLSSVYIEANRHHVPSSIHRSSRAHDTPNHSSFATPVATFAGSWPPGAGQFYNVPVNSLGHRDIHHRHSSDVNQPSSHKRTIYNNPMRQLSEHPRSLDSRNYLSSTSSSQSQSSSEWSPLANINTTFPTSPRATSTNFSTHMTRQSNIEEALDWSQFKISGDGSPPDSLPPDAVPNPSWHNQPNIQINPFDSQAWNDMIMTAMDSSLTNYATPHLAPTTGFPYRISPGPSPSPSPIQHLASSGESSASTSRRGSVDRSGSLKQCSHCHATSTPLWRREPTTLKPLCNACGLYLQQRNKLRPQELIDADTDDGDDTDESDVNYVGPECSHCHTHRTSVWRRSKTGEQLCNACGVYARLRGKPRPLSLRKKKIKPRSKHSAK